jgi:predicted nucleic acid-binding protein
MILADTSVWVEFFRGRQPASFSVAITAKRILIHSAVIGELATGNLRDRAATLAMLRSLPRAQSGTTEECLQAIETHRLHRRGINWIDVQLLVAALLSHARLWSLDLALMEAARRLHVAYSVR